MEWIIYIFGFLGHFALAVRILVIAFAHYSTSYKSLYSSNGFLFSFMVWIWSIVVIMFWVWMLS